MVGVQAYAEVLPGGGGDAAIFEGGPTADLPSASTVVAMDPRGYSRGRLDAPRPRGAAGRGAGRRCVLPARTAHAGAAAIDEPTVWLRVRLTLTPGASPSRVGALEVDYYFERLSNYLM
jgi:hypothetical protein